MVDERQIAFRPAVEISYLSEEQQYTLLEAMEYNDATPSLAQAIKMKKFMQDGKLTDEVIQSIMQEEKPNQREKRPLSVMNGLPSSSLRLSPKGRKPTLWSRRWSSTIATCSGAKTVNDSHTPRARSVHWRIAIF